MSKTKMNVIAFLITSTVCVAFYQYARFVGGQEALVARFPDLDPEVIRKIGKQMILNALKGKYNNRDTSSDEMWDEIFLEEYARAKYPHKFA